jgi:tRNA A37 threonylcarbamoyladenosine dehydratase
MTTTDHEPPADLVERVRQLPILQKKRLWELVAPIQDENAHLLREELQRRYEGILDGTNPVFSAEEAMASLRHELEAEEPS